MNAQADQINFDLIEWYQRICFKICFDQCWQIAKIAMSPNHFCRHLEYLFNESKGRLIFPRKSFLFLSNDFQKQPYNWVIRFTLVIIINNVCVSKYAYAAIAVFKWDTENICISLTGT